MPAPCSKLLIFQLLQLCPCVYHNESFPNFCLTLSLHSIQTPNQTGHLIVSQSYSLPGKPDTVPKSGILETDTEMLRFGAGGLLGSSREDVRGREGQRVGQRKRLNHDVSETEASADPMWNSGAEFHRQVINCVQGPCTLPPIDQSLEVGLSPTSLPPAAREGS